MTHHPWKQISRGPCPKKEDHAHHTHNCICEQLRKLQTQTEVDIFLIGGQVLEDLLFIDFNPKNNCAFFRDTTTEPDSTLIVDCRAIEALRIEAS